MCGICGIIELNGKNGNGVDHSTAVRHMTGRLVHRGPDAEGFWSENGIALGHRRLMIIDLSGSQQPMQDPTDRYIIVFNGEIYNYLELRSEIAKNGVRFHSNGDTEVLLQAYILYGERCLEKLNGMFAFAVWDRKEEVLFAARDRMGVKPFFYGEKGKNLFAFASEIQAFRDLPLDFSLNKDSLVQYFRHGFIFSPATIFQGLRELPPAHFLRYSRKGLELHRYWKPPRPDETLRNRSLGDLAEELREHFRSSVSLRLRSDVPLGAFLSGGLDSSIVVSCMSDLGAGAVHTHCIGFETETFDETAYAQKVAAYFGTVHSDAHGEMDPRDVLFEIVRHYGQPYGDSSCIPTWYLCKKTAEDLTVALSGDGADELFCGYNRYLAGKLLDYYRVVPGIFRKRTVPAILKYFREGTGYYGRSLIKKLRLFVSLDQRTGADLIDIYGGCFTLGELERLLEMGTVQSGLETPAIPDILPETNAKGLDLMAAMDFHHYLPDDILTKVDRTSMAHALEVRSPFMDYRLVEFTCQLPVQYKLHGWTTKYLLRKAFAGDLPPEPLTRRKHGFAVPLGNWFQGTLRELYLDLLHSRHTPTFLNVTEAEHLLHEHQSGQVDHGNRLWLILFLNAWSHWWHGETGVRFS